MSEPFWKELLARVGDERKDRHLDRVREHLGWDLSRPSLEKELLKEIAGSLARSEQRVADAIAALAPLAARAHESEEALAAFERARAKALRARRDLAIQREALRLPPDPELERRHPIPPRARSAGSSRAAAPDPAARAVRGLQPSSTPPRQGTGTAARVSSR
jgi:hypothetical protein